MKSSIFYISLLFSLLLLGCSKKEKVKEPQIHLVSSALIDNFVMGEQKTRYEYYIVSNYDSNEEKALNLIRMFNEDLIRNKESIINNYDLYNRAFYKESEKTPYDFANDYGFSPDYIDDHSEDLICYISMDKRVIFKDTIVKWSSSCENIK